MRKARDPAKARKRKIIIAVIIEIVVMTIEVVCVLLPMPWRLVVPIVIGARAIIMQAVRKSKEQPQVVHCHGDLPLKTTQKRSNGNAKKTKSK